MKKLLFTLSALVLFSGCSNSSNPTYEERVEEMEKRIILCEDAGLAWHEYNSKVWCDDLDSKCVDICEDLFDEYTDTWGADGNSDKTSESILKCFNDCILRHSS